MKKLMFAAVAAAAAGVFAACDRPDVVVDGAEVYDVVINLKTTKCVCKNITTVNKTACEREVNTTCESWREVVSKKVNGVIWSCAITCSDDIGDAETPLALEPAWWDEIADPSESQGNQYFWLAKDKIILADTDLWTTKWIARIGKGNKKVEAFGTFGDGLNWAGFGAWDAKKVRVSKISGGIAGCWGAPYDCSSYDADNKQYTEDCPAYKLCDDDMKDDYTKTAAYGTFSIKYNASKAKKLAAGKLVGNVIPSAYKAWTKATDFIYGYESIGM